MSGNIAGFLELALVFGGLLALLVFELISVRRAQRGDRDRAQTRDGGGERRD